MHELGGFLTLDDLRKNQPTWVTPISVPFQGYRVWEMPPNNQGVAVLEMLRILEPYDLRAMGHNSARYLHHLIEAKKLAYADLARYVGDADHLTIPVERLLSDRFIAERRSHLNSDHAATRVDPGPALGSETIYLTAADSAGNMVSFINSLYDLFGSGVVVPGTGFALQNRGAGFTLEDGLPNTVAPGKRPFHTLIPAFVTKDDQPYMSFGLMGGSMQAQGHVQFLLNLFVFGMELQPAMDAARFRHLDGTRVVLEPPVPDSVRAALTAMGHTIVPGAARAVRRQPGHHPAAPGIRGGIRPAEGRLRCRILSRDGVDIVVVDRARDPGVVRARAGGAAALRPLHRRGAVQKLGFSAYGVDQVVEQHRATARAAPAQPGGQRRDVDRRARSAPCAPPAARPGRPAAARA